MHSCPCVSLHFVLNVLYSELVQLNTSPHGFASLLFHTQTHTVMIPAVFAGKLNGICAAVFAVVIHWKGPVLKASH